MDYISDILSNFQLKTVHVDPGITFNSFYFSYQNSAVVCKIPNAEVEHRQSSFFLALSVSILQKTTECFRSKNHSWKFKPYFETKIDDVLRVVY